MQGFRLMRLTRLFGRLTGMAQPLMYFPTLVYSSCGHKFGACYFEALAKRRQSTLSMRAQESIRLGFLFALPAAVGLFIFAEEFSLMLRWPAEVGSSFEAAGGLEPCFFAIQQISSGILQGLGAVGVPVRNLAKGALAKFIVSFSLTGMPAFGIRGAALGTVAAFAVAGLMNVSTLIRMLGFTLDVSNKCA